MIEPRFPKLVDLHCHLDLYPDFPEIVSECEQQSIYTLTVTTTPKAWPRNNEVTAKTKYVRPALGLHPQLVAGRASEFAIWEEYLSQTKYVGEVGLDAGPSYFQSIDLQQQVFERVLHACAKAGGKVLTVHSLRAVKRVLDLLEKNLPPDRSSVVLHWFTGSKLEACRAIDLGCYFSINAEMLGNNRHREWIARLPIDRILTETDGPFTKNAGRPSRPSDVRGLLESLSGLFDSTPEYMTAIVQDNFERLVFPF